MKIKKTIKIFALISTALIPVSTLSIWNTLPLQVEEPIAVSASESTDDVAQNALLVIREPTSDSYMDNIYYQWLRALTDAEGGVLDNAVQTK